MPMKMTVYVYTEDLDKVQAFYEAALGTAPHDYGDWRPFDLGAASFALHRVPAGSGRDLRTQSISFDVDDIDAAVERCTAAGATVVDGISEKEFGKLATLQDPDGREFDLMQHTLS